MDDLPLVTGTNFEELTGTVLVSPNICKYTQVRIISYVYESGATLEWFIEDGDNVLRVCC